MPPDLTLNDWLLKEATNVVEINSLLNDTDELLSISKNTDSYSKVWMQNIFDALNKVNFESPKGGKWKEFQFRDIYELIRYNITYDRGIYNFLNEKGLINTGRCPITGDPVDKGCAYSFFGRSVEMSKKGLEIAKSEDPDYDEKFAERKKQAIKNNNGGCFGVLFFTILIMLTSGIVVI